MRLEEAYRSGKKFRLGATGNYITAAEFNTGSYNVQQLISDSWVTEPEGRMLTLGELTLAWDEVSEGFQTVKSAAESPVFVRLAAKLFEAR